MGKYTNIFELYANQPEKTISADLLLTIFHEAGILIDHITLTDVLKSLHMSQLEKFSFEEYLRILKELQSLQCHTNNVQVLRDAFRCFDKNQTGFIGENILRDILIDSKIFADLEIEEALKLFDKDDHGNIRYETYIKKFEIRQ